MVIANEPFLRNMSKFDLDFNSWSYGGMIQAEIKFSKDAPDIHFTKIH
jgi:hypothetical protein